MFNSSCISYEISWLQRNNNKFSLIYHWSFITTFQVIYESSNWVPGWLRCTAAVSPPDTARARGWWTHGELS